MKETGIFFAGVSFLVMLIFSVVYLSSSIAKQESQTQEFDFKTAYVNSQIEVQYWKSNAELWKARYYSKPSNCGGGSSIQVQSHIELSQSENQTQETEYDASDFNQDGVVDTTDLTIFSELYETLQNEFGNNCSSPEWCNGADMNKDGTVDTTDLTILASIKPEY